MNLNDLCIFYIKILVFHGWLKYCPTSVADLEMFCGLHFKKLFHTVDDITELPDDLVVIWLYSIIYQN